MEELGKAIQFGVLSPEPKRFSVNLSQNECLEIPRSYSCDDDQEFAISELNYILSTSNFPSIGRNSSPLFKKFSLLPPDRSKTNPMIFDEKFIELEYSLSTSEVSGSDTDLFIQNN